MMIEARIIGLRIDSNGIGDEWAVMDLSFWSGLEKQKITIPYSEGFSMGDRVTIQISKTEQIK